MNPKPQLQVKPVVFRLELDATGNPTADRLRALLAGLQGLIPIVKKIQPWNPFSKEALFILNQVLENGSHMIQTMLAEKGVIVFNVQTDAHEIMHFRDMPDLAADPDGTGVIDPDQPGPEL